MPASKKTHTSSTTSQRPCRSGSALSLASNHSQLTDDVVEISSTYETADDGASEHEKAQSPEDEIGEYLLPRISSLTISQKHSNALGDHQFIGSSHLTLSFDMTMVAPTTGSPVRRVPARLAQVESVAIKTSLTKPPRPTYGITQFVAGVKRQFRMPRQKSSQVNRSSLHLRGVVNNLSMSRIANILTMKSVPTLSNGSLRATGRQISSMTKSYRTSSLLAALNLSCHHLPLFYVISKHHLRGAEVVLRSFCR